MYITLITPAPPGSRAGNRATAERWARLLTAAGHHVRVLTEPDSQAADLFIALHAWRSHDAVCRLKADFPDTPLIVVLTGTDIYQFQHSAPAPTLESMALADILIGLHDRVAADIPAEYHPKLMTVLQSADRQRHDPGTGNDGGFDVCVIGHLRDEKDSLRAARAARLVPPHSRLRILNAGKAHNPQWEAMARAEEAGNDRFCWLGELDQAAVRGLMQRSRLMVISSVMEGGANVVSEACRAGLPVLASNIPGNRGLLGDDYAGYYPPQDEQALARLLWRAESQPAYLAGLADQVAERATRFTPEAEQAALLAAVNRAKVRPAG